MARLRRLIAVVSVPLRGVGCFADNSEKSRRRELFPSPCGVWVVSMTIYIAGGITGFPSPCGVWVVSTCSSRQCRTARCFRPLAGCGLFPSEREIIAAILVSVPLRGVGCFCDKRCEACQYPEFPSSCGVWVVSYNRHTGRTKWMFPSPCGVWVVSPLRGGPLPPLGFRPLAGCGLFRGRRHSNRGKACFRPLAGCGLFPPNQAGVQDRGGFRPLAGCGLFLF